MTALYIPGAVVPQVPNRWPKANAWLYGYVKTDHPGYRQVTVGGVLQQVEDGYHRWDEYIDALDTALGSAGWAAVIGPEGKVSLTGGDEPLVWPDRMGWLLGMVQEAGDASVAGLETESRWVPPGGIPLLGATWERMRHERETEIIADRSRRFGGYVWGGARLWSWRLVMTRYAYDALCAGWCLRGKVTIAGSSLTAMGSAVPGGALTGYVLGLEGAPSWVGPTQQDAEVTLIVASAG